MKSRYVKFLKSLLLFSAIVGLAVLVVMIVLPKTYVTPALPYLVVFFMATTLLSFYSLLEASSKRFMKFVNTFFLIMLIKLFAYAGVMITYVLLNRGDAIPFMGGFFILYLCYTIFESVSIIRYTQPPNPDRTV
jgi:hypothetical protein